jgi:hypothetical protein
LVFDDDADGGRAAVVDIRLRQIIAGEGTPADVFLMVTEKMDAAAEARTIFLRSGDCN